MKLSAKKILRIVLPIAALLIPIQVLAQELSIDDQTSGTKREVSVSAPDLADIIPLATKLSGNLVILENKVNSVLEVSEIERKYARN